MQDRSSIPKARTTPTSKLSVARSARSTAEHLLQLDNVSVRYPNADVPAIEGFSLSVGPNERVALVGPSGAGKSTVLAVAAGLTLPTSGSVEVFGVDSVELGRRAHRSTRSKIGIISQDFSLVGPLRVASNVAAGRLGRWSWLQSVKTLVRPGPIDEIAQALERVGIDQKVWERADQLSGGQQQRTAIARVLFQGPELVLADEPVSSLDPARSEAVMAELALPAGNGMAMVASMHDGPLALRHCDRIVALRNGRLCFDLPSADVTEAMLTELYALDDA